MIARLLAFALLFAASTGLMSAQIGFPSLHGQCSLAPTANSDQVRFEVKGNCNADHTDCHDRGSNSLPLSNFTGITPASFQQNGSRVTAVLAADAGRTVCSGVVRDHTLRGDFTFVQNSTFVARMRKMGITGFDSDTLEAFSISHIEIKWIKALQSAGVPDLDSSNVFALHMFKVNVDYVREMAELGYPHLSAHKLIALKIQGVNPNEVRQYRSLGYQPNLDQLVQMRIFKITPGFIERVQAHGLGHPAVAKLIQIRIFRLAN